MAATAEMAVTTVGALGVMEAVASWGATVGWLGVAVAAGWVCGRRRCAALTRTRVSRPRGLGRRSTDMPPTSGTWRRKMCWKLTRWGRRARHPCMHDGSGYSCSPQHPLGTARDTPVGLDLSIAFRRARPRRPSSTRRTRRDGVRRRYARTPPNCRHVACRMACSYIHRRGATGVFCHCSSPIRASCRPDYNKDAFCRRQQNLPSKGRTQAYHRLVPGSHSSVHSRRGRTSSQTRGAQVGGGEVMARTAERVVTVTRPM